MTAPRSLAPVPHPFAAEVSLSLIFPTSVRLPAKLRQLLRKEAKREGRSFVKHIEWILTKWFVDRGIDVDEQEIQRKKKLAKEVGVEQ